MKNSTDIILPNLARSQFIEISSKQIEPVRILLNFKKNLFKVDVSIVKRFHQRSKRVYKTKPLFLSMTLNLNFYCYSPWKRKNIIEPGRGRTCNLLIRSQTRYPFRHRSHIISNKKMCFNTQPVNDAIQEKESHTVLTLF